MITLRKLKTFRSVNGDIDALSRGWKRSSNDLSETECGQLNELLQKLVICRRGLGSVGFCESAKQECLTLVPDENVRLQIEALASEKAGE